MALSETQNQLLNFFEQYWFVHGTVPSEDFCADNGLDRAFYKKCIKDKEFREALIGRDIRIKGITIEDDPFTKMNALTEEQLTVANVLLDREDTRSRKKKLADLEISTAKLNSWYKDPAFQHYLRTRAEGALGDVGAVEADLALLDNLRSGDLSAIKYFNEFTGRYRPNESRDSVDVKQLLQLFIEVIQRHVTDADTQAAIATELLTIANAMKAISPNAFSNATHSGSPVGNNVIQHKAIASGI